MLLTLETINDLLPDYMREIFLPDASVTPRVLPVVNRFCAFFDDSGQPLFKHYTDHSSRHCLEVFRTGIEFVAPGVQRILSAKDINYFLLACFVHGCDMSITKTQFNRLVSSDNTEILCTLDEFSWPALWHAYMEEARRFSDRTLEQVFGDMKPVEAPPANVADYTDRHRRLIGEFLRRNHPRLAHDIVLGLDQLLGLGQMLEGFRFEENDLIGLLARSHGAPMRMYFHYVESRFDLRDYNRTHIIFLMAMLRIADYAQLQPHRASITKAAIHPVASPISQREWRVHLRSRRLIRESLIWR